MMSKAHQMHFGVAEAGKLLALKGRHADALARYREALRLAHGARAPQIFARHYLHCVLESLEHLGAHAQAAELAGAAAGATSDAAAEANGAATPFQRRDRAHLLERQGVNLLRAGDVGAARAVLAEALALDAGLGLAAEILQWTARGLTVSAARLAEAQARRGYWVVRRGTVDAARAIEHPLADSIGPERETAHG